ncbi:MAG: tRNA 5-methoxyuridine(34)/uridine 5-oxyacetic acid(34) synthase CmoB [Pseudomonadales bacterium]|nr:tRNA 5-methoxyuridine(34)/uridine 5-oxyacetic acid(34) synthase CmoB [Pseudomonadales bacterium]
MTRDAFFRKIKGTPLETWTGELSRVLDAHEGRARHGDEARWSAAVNGLPSEETSDFDIGSPVIRIGQAAGVGAATIADHLANLMPWRKGPWQLFGVDVDTEWRSDLKWARLAPHISPLASRHILDVGCGNGYYLLRMLGEGAAFALGIDPTILFTYQFRAMTRCLPNLMAEILPLRSEDLPPLAVFDTVFSMGVLSHRREPSTHLAELYGFLRPGGELVLETLVTEENGAIVFDSGQRYAQMRNIWCLPDTGTLETWLRQAGFGSVRIVDVTRTSTSEQRATRWMTFQSLRDFLDPTDPSKTIEGWPAPTRAIAIAERPR